ncbi:LADA_0E14378g1_1 [Lachancea dasiensis]|uniref:Ubiquinone biosynthesis protein n=1 Tax=Lachancea dasiensis TaxID=1072105 RepID=A0A1G4JGD8_9SACH|nr:LADA_0E14378g1_1 [Lachancea dasiensis]
MKLPPRILCRRLYHPNVVEHQVKHPLFPLTYGPHSLQYKVLENTLSKYVPLYGFDERAIVASANELGLGGAVISALGAHNSPSFFHTSPAVLELVKFHLVTKRYALTNALDPSRAPGGLSSIPDELPTLEALFKRRLELNVPIGSHLTPLLSMLSIPGEYLVNTALPELHRLSDDLVFFSQEKDSHDFAWYAKRAAISCAFVSSELFMAQDKSHNFNKTFEFAEEKLHKVTKLGEYYNNTEEYMWYTLLTSINLAKSQLTRG